jgi:hypothetical protein
VSRWLASLPLLLAASCAMFDEPRPEPRAAAPRAAAPASARSSSADELVAYLAQLRGLSDSALGAEAARQRREATDLARVKAALALALSAQAEESEILALVEPVVRHESADPDVKAMAGFLHALASERRRLKQNAAAAGTRLKEEQRAVEAQKQRADALQQKLDGLTELEKSLSDRSPAPR